MRDDDEDIPFDPPEEYEGEGEDRDPDAPLEESLLGEVIDGKYKLAHVQGAGFYSVVFVAHQFFCGRFVRPVAIKVSRQAGLDEDTAPRLFSDALVLASLLAQSDHEGRRHLVQIHDMGLLPDHDGRAYLVMEHVDGLPLLSHMRGVAHPVASVVRWLEQIALAVSLVHEGGAIHRDLIPENILLDKRGDVRVVDFGLAAYADPEAGFVPGAIGTYAWMAPETLLGKSVPASDIYSIGLIAYELLTGGGPHLAAKWARDAGRDTSRDNHRVKTALRFPPPSESNNEVRNEHRWLDALVARCLDPDPARRWRDAGALLEAIRAGKAGQRLGDAVALQAAPRGDDDSEALFRDVRKLLGSREYAAALDRLDIHRPAEWATLDLKGARTLRAMAQAFAGLGRTQQARECLEQLRAGQRERAVLSGPDYAAALSDLVRCYRALGLNELAAACQEEARQLG
ncbi:MAG: serine/threonine-protein kinase [Gemmataceae bacterium]|nr:serine/threonine-protein kinase [Gemmataceae bacterium]